MALGKFKVMTTHLRGEMRERCPRFIDFAIVEPHRNQATRNHSQTLERLHQRGGLDPRELIAVLEDRDWNTIRSIDEETAIDRIIAVCAREGAKP